MNRKLILLNNSTQMLSTENINKLIVEINKLQINKSMKKFLLIAASNLLSPVKTSKGLTYQLETFRNQGKIYPEKTKSKYINNLIKDLKTLSVSEFTDTITNLINFINTNNITLKI